MPRAAASRASPPCSWLLTLAPALKGQRFPFGGTHPNAISSGQTPLLGAALRPSNPIAQREEIPLVQSRACDRGGLISPDGNWLAFVSDVSGREEIYVQPFPGAGPSTQVSVGGASEPLWSPDAQELFYVPASQDRHGGGRHAEPHVHCQPAEVAVRGASSNLPPTATHPTPSLSTGNDSCACNSNCRTERSHASKSC